MLERITDGLCDGGFGRHTAELFLEEALERFAMWRGLLSTRGASLLGALASDGLFDPVERGDAHECLGCNGSIAFPGDLEEAAPDVRPAEGERDRIVRQLLVRRVTVTLHDTAIIPEQRVQMHRASARRIPIGDGGRIRSAERSAW